MTCQGGEVRSEPTVNPTWGQQSGFFSPNSADTAFPTSKGQWDLALLSLNQLTGQTMLRRPSYLPIPAWLCPGNCGKISGLSARGPQPGANPCGKSLRGSRGACPWSSCLWADTSHSQLGHLTETPSERQHKALPTAPLTVHSYTSIKNPH